MRQTRESSLVIPLRRLREEVAKVGAARDRIIDALVEELAERPLDDVRVYELIRRAKVSHTTYYKYFASPDEVFAALAERFVDGMAAGCPLPSGRDQGFGRALFDALVSYVYDHRTEYVALSQGGPEGVFGARLAQCVTHLYEEGASAILGSEGSDTQEFAFLCGHMFVMEMEVYRMRDFDLEPEEFATHLWRLLVADTASRVL